MIFILASSPPRSKAGGPILHLAGIFQPAGRGPFFSTPIKSRGFTWPVFSNRPAVDRSSPPRAKAGDFTWLVFSDRPPGSGTFFSILIKSRGLHLAGFFQPAGRGPFFSAPIKSRGVLPVCIL
ncbi:MAG: hypothetical protein Q4D81_10860 [Eubacteriales bacterium]|nr:hypothetical protein [Eubacteriales bacterium]